jgi:hypothetical protein
MRSETLNDNYHKHRELLSYTKYRPEAIPGETEILLPCSRAFIRSAYIDSQMSGRARKRNASTEASHQPTHPNIYPVVRLRLRARKYRSLVPNVSLFMEANRTSPVQPQALEAMIRVPVYPWHTALRSAGCDFHKEWLVFGGHTAFSCSAFLLSPLCVCSLHPP